MKTLKQLLDDKGRDVWTIGPDMSVYDAVKLMAEKEIGALLVVEGEKPVGMVTERDYARKVILRGKTSQEALVSEIMTTHVLCARPEQSVEECMAIMTEKRVRHLPVIENGKLIGMVSIGDLVKAIIDEQQFIIQQLEHYITS
jgi:CBS domain-containing protein